MTKALRQHFTTLTLSILQTMKLQMSSVTNTVTVLSPGLRRANIHSLCHQRVVVALDNSASMFEQQKAQHAFDALRECCGQLALPPNKDAFEMAVIYFDQKAEVIHPFEKVSTLIGHLQPLDATRFGGSTNITSALELGRQILEEAAEQPSGLPIRYVLPITVLMSDGRHNTGSHPIQAGQDLKGVSDVLTVAFGDDADEAVLHEIATEQCSVRCRTGAELRGYFAQIGRTLTVTRAAGLSPVAAWLNSQQ